MSETTKASKGMVFWFDPDKRAQNSGIYKNTHLGSKGMYLVVALHNTLCTLLPVVDQWNISEHTTVSFEYLTATKYILIDEITTVDESLLDTYKFTVKKSVLAQVEEKLIEHLGISKDKFIPYSSISEYEDDVISGMKNIISLEIDKYKKQLDKKYASSNKSVNEAASKINQILRSTFGDSVNPIPEISITAREVTSEDNSNKDEQLEDIFDTATKPEAEQKERTKRRKNYSYHKWTDEDIDNFLIDCSKMDKYKVQAKYHLATVKRVYATRKYLLDKIKQSGADISKYTMYKENKATK